MNRKENNKMNMFKAVSAVLFLYEETANRLPPLIEVVLRFRAVIERILQLDSEYTSTMPGATSSKKSAAELVAGRTYRLAKALYALGRKKENKQLIEQCRYSRSSISHLRYTNILQMGTLMSVLAQTYIQELEVYGIKTEDVNDLNAAIDNFKAMSDEQMQKIAEAKVAREQLYKAFDEADTILKHELDVLIELQKEIEPELYNHYKAVRLIKDLGVRRSSGSYRREQSTGTDENRVAEEVETPAV